MAHPTCNQCGMVLVWITLNGQPVLACPRATCTGHGKAAA
jgi:hypothetical protein